MEIRVFADLLRKLPARKPKRMSIASARVTQDVKLRLRNHAYTRGVTLSELLGTVVEELVRELDGLEPGRSGGPLDATRPKHPESIPQDPVELT
jgi:hypothetical protein